MPPPARSRKKRKSRGASARRNRHKSLSISTAVRDDQPSTSDKRKTFIKRASESNLLQGEPSSSTENAAAMNSNEGNNIYSSLIEQLNSIKVKHPVTPTKEANKSNVLKKCDTNSNATNTNGTGKSICDTDNLSPNLADNSANQIASDKNNSLQPDGTEILTSEEKKALRKTRKEEKKKGKVGSSNDQENKTHQQPSSSAQVDPIDQKSKAELRKERREKQEAQRALKMQQHSVKTASNTIIKATNSTSVKKPTTPHETKDKITKSKADKKSKIPLLGHLTCPSTAAHKLSVNSEYIHPAVRTAGLHMKEFVVDGCIARVLRTLSALSALISDYQKPPHCDFSRDLSTKMAPNIKFLRDCRHIPEPLENAIKFVCNEINNIEASVPESQARELLIQAIDTYVQNNIVLASKTIAKFAQQLINDGDVILTFGCSPLFVSSIKCALDAGKKLSVVVVDRSQPCTGALLVHKLHQLGVHVHYTLLTDLSHVMNKVTQVMVEAEAVVLNGAIVGPCGMAYLLLQAAAQNTPVVILSHTFKFCNHELNNSLVANEIDTSVRLSECCPNKKYAGLLLQESKGEEGEISHPCPSLNVVSLVYDVAPPQLLTCLVTELDILPTSVVPVIIRRNQTHLNTHKR